MLKYNINIGENKLKQAVKKYQIQSENKKKDVYNI